MWFFEMKFGKKSVLGGHFYTREEMYEWFESMLKHYTFRDKFYELKIWFDGSKDENVYKS